MCAAYRLERHLREPLSGLRCPSSSAHGRHRRVVVQEQTFQAQEAGTIDLPDATERAAIAADPMRSLERAGGRHIATATAEEQTAALEAFSAARHAPGADVALNRELKRGMRARRVADKADERRRDAAFHSGTALLRLECVDLRHDGYAQAVEVGSVQVGRNIPFLGWEAVAFEAALC